MTAVLDANLILYAYDELSPHHAWARDWLTETINGEEPVLLPWTSLFAFLRISTNPRAQTRPLLTDKALQLAMKLMEHPNVSLIGPGERHWEIFSRLCGKAQVRGPLVTDAHLAALAIENGAVLCSANRDFSRFPGLRWRNPIENV